MTKDKFDNLKVGDKVRVNFENNDFKQIVEVRHKLSQSCIVRGGTFNDEYHYSWLGLVKPPSALIFWISNPRL